MKRIKRLTMCAALLVAYAAKAQMVVTNPTQDFILIESKIETASSWLQQLQGLQQTIQLARQQAGKLDSAKRAMEKAYQLQDDVRKDVVNSYNAVKNMSIDNLAHITQNYLGFSINPQDYLPNMPGLEGYSEFRKSLDYNPRTSIAGGTAGIDRFLSSIVLTDSSTIIDNPTQDYFRRLDQINNLAGAYGSIYLYRQKAELDLLNNIAIPKTQDQLDLYRSMLDSVNSVSDIIALNEAIANLEARVEALNKEKNARLQDLLDHATRVANIQHIVKEKQKDIVVLTAAISCHYNLNKNFSLRKLAAQANNKTKLAEVKRKSKEDIQHLKTKQ